MHSCVLLSEVVSLVLMGVTVISITENVPCDCLSSRLAEMSLLMQPHVTNGRSCDICNCNT